MCQEVKTLLDKEQESVIIDFSELTPHSLRISALSQLFSKIKANVSADDINRMSFLLKLEQIAILNPHKTHEDISYFNREIKQIKTFLNKIGYQSKAERIRARIDTDFFYDMIKRNIISEHFSSLLHSVLYELNEDDFANKYLKINIPFKQIIEIINSN
jgi:hypothetical protein